MDMCKYVHHEKYICIEIRNNYGERDREGERGGPK